MYFLLETLVSRISKFVFAYQGNPRKIRQIGKITMGKKRMEIERGESGFIGFAINEKWGGGR